MKHVIFTGGSYGPADFYKKFLTNFGSCRIVCADKGVEMAEKLSIVPDLVVGDFDSVPSGTAERLAEKNVPLVRYPVRKDLTDTELAMDFCIEEKSEMIVLFGALGSRLDHMIASLHTLSRAHTARIPARLVDPVNDVRLLSGRNDFDLPVGTTVSFIAYAGEASGVVLEGFEYSASDAHFDRFHGGWGVSNVTALPHQHIEVENGLLMMDIVHEEKAESY